MNDTKQNHTEVAYEKAFTTFICFYPSGSYIVWWDCRTLYSQLRPCANGVGE